jgi:3-phenylpropionate/trans-cinnamate dioxygenase ferredoxin subunit
MSRAPEKTKHPALPLSELEPGQMKSVVVEGIDVVIARDLDGSVYALRDRCAHAAARLTNGRLLRKVAVGGEVDRYELTDELIIRCPWHGYEYELPTGRCLADPNRTRVRAYPVTIENGTICIEK